MATRATTAAPAYRPGGIDPFRTAWNLLTNVKFALLLVGIAAGAGLLGVLLPQVPIPMRDNPPARAAWIELRREDFGPFTDLMDRFDLFDVFHAPWFYALWILIIVAVTVCTVSRFRPTARSVHHPMRTVGDRYFETAHHRADFAHPGGIEAIESALRGRRYRIERTKEQDGTIYLFAERYAWSAYGTFASHLALLMLLIGGLLTFFGGFERTLVLAEGLPGAAVFDTPGPHQMFVKVDDAYRGIDDDGNIIHYQSLLEVTRGDETITCKTTVNDPCHAFGYRIHQAAFFDDLAGMTILGPNGTVQFADVLDFENRTTRVPQLRVSNPDGAVLFDQVLPQMGTDPGASDDRADDVALAGLTFPTGVGSTTSYAVSWRIVDGGLRVAVIDANGVPRQLPAGAAVRVGEYDVTFVAPRDIPAANVADMPGTNGAGAVVQMPTDAAGNPYLFVSGIGDENIVLLPGQPYESGEGYSYTFDGRVEASGVSVKRDPGDTFIWIAVAMAMIGLGITFYVPRRRLWVKVTPARTYFAGIAEKTTRLGRELRLMGAELGSSDALRPEDREP